MDAVFEAICDGARHNRLLSLARFLGVMGTLNPALSTELLASDFEKMAAARRERGEGDAEEAAVDNGQLLEYAVEHAVEGVREHERLSDAVGHFWARQRLPIQRTLAELAVKRKRLEKVGVCMVVCTNVLRLKKVGSCVFMCYTLEAQNGTYLLRQF